MVTVQDYFDSVSNVADTRKADLRVIENIIFDLGYEWLHVPENAWLTIFQTAKLRAPELLIYAERAISQFYTWLKKNGYEADPPYSGFDISTLFASEVEKMYPPSLRTLLGWSESVSINPHRTSAYAKLTTQGFLIMLWADFSIEEMILIKTNDLIFLNDGLRILKPTSVLDFDVISICDKRFVSLEINEILFSLWEYSMKVAKEQGVTSLPLFLTEKHVPFTRTSAQVRLLRRFEKINEEYGLKLNATNIKTAGKLEKAYHYWFANHLPWKYSPSAVLKLYELTEDKVASSLSVKRAKFEHFLQYVKNVQNQSI